MNPIIIIGSGLSGYTVAREFRKRDTETPLMLITADDGASYSKPMLSNGLDKGKSADQLIMASAEKMAESLNMEVKTNTEVIALEPNQRCIETADRRLEYHELVLALGADPIRLPLAGNAAQQVVSVNDLNDYRTFRALVEGNKSVAILGGGLIGCEFANDLCRAGRQVHVIDPAPWPLGRLLPQQAALGLQNALQAKGVNWHFGVTAEQIDQHGEQLQLDLSDGRQLQVDVVLSAVGLTPRTALARAAGLKINRGIVVDRYLKSDHAHIYALGDCAEVDGLVLPYVMPLMNAARAIAASLSGEPSQVQYPVMPVAVKTPDYPTVVCPPRNGAQGNWTEQVNEAGVEAEFIDDQGRVVGFALTGDAVTLKPTFLKKTLPLCEQ